MPPPTRTSTVTDTPSTPNHAHVSWRPTQGSTWALILGQNDPPNTGRLLYICLIHIPDTHYHHHNRGAIRKYLSGRVRWRKLRRRRIGRRRRTQGSTWWRPCSRITYQHCGNHHCSNLGRHYRDSQHHRPNNCPTHLIWQNIYT